MQELKEMQELQGVQDELALEDKEGTDKYNLEQGKNNIKNIETMDSQSVLAVPLGDMNTMAVQQVQEDQMPRGKCNAKLDTDTDT